MTSDFQNKISPSSFLILLPWPALLALELIKPHEEVIDLGVTILKHHFLNKAGKM